MARHVRSWFSNLLTLVLSMLAAIPAFRVHAQNMGRVGAVNPDATGTPPGAASRTLAIGTNIVHKEKVQTSSAGSAQILFPDSSTLNIGHNSSIVIDEYVYDPNAGTGQMVASVSKGVMRFVGGQISHTAGVTINTPVASLGIRGGVATVVYPITAAYAASDPNIANCKGELIVGHVGSVVIKNSAGSATVRPGFATCVTGPNDPIPEPFRVADGTLAAIMTSLTSKPGQSGGAIDLPTDSFASRTGTPATGFLPNPTHPPGTDPLGYVSIFSAGNATSQNKSQGNQTTQTQSTQTTGNPPGTGGNTTPPYR